ncbi:polysaccharide export protein, partial [Pseudoalteromonas sp. SIMBA_148]
HVSIRLEEWAPLAVAVSGAVFFPGEAVINTRLPEERMVRRDFTGGDASQQRRLSAALTTAGGIRPDADLSHIELIRDGQTQILDMRGLIDGEYAANPWLRVGDRIHVPS